MKILPCVHDANFYLFLCTNQLLLELYLHRLEHFQPKSNLKVSSKLIKMIKTIEILNLLDISRDSLKKKNYSVISREMQPLAALYPHVHKKIRFLKLRASLSIPLSVIAGGGMLMPTAFAPISIVSV